MTLWPLCLSQDPVQGAFYQPPAISSLYHLHITPTTFVVLPHLCTLFLVVTSIVCSRAADQICKAVVPGIFVKTVYSCNTHSLLSNPSTTSGGLVALLQAQAANKGKKRKRKRITQQTSSAAYLSVIIVTYYHLNGWTPTILVYVITDTLMQV